MIAFFGLAVRSIPKDSKNFCRFLLDKSTWKKKAAEFPKALKTGLSGEVSIDQQLILQLSSSLVAKLSSHFSVENTPDWTPSVGFIRLKDATVAP